MRKLIYGILTLLLVVTGCSSNDSKKTEEVLRAENRAAMEAEQKAKEEMKAELEDKKQEEQTEEEKKVDDITITDKESVMDFIFQQFDVSDSYSKERGMNELTFTYEDFNEDGKEDVVVYSPNKDGFYDIAFVTVTENGYELIDEFEEYSKNEQSIVKEGNFIIFRGAGGGTGVYKKFLKIYRYVDGEIAFTGVALDLEGHDTIAHDDYPNGKPIEISSELIDRSGKFNNGEDIWFAFDYTYMETDIDGKLLLKTCDGYYYNNETNAYEVQQLESKFVTKDAANEALVSDGRYELEQLMSVEKLEEFKVVEVSYIKMGEFSLILEGEITQKGRIRFDGLYQMYCFTSDEAFLDYPIRIDDELTISTHIRFSCFDQKWIKELPQSAHESLKENGELEIACTINKIEIHGAWGTSGSTSIEISNIDILSNTTSDQSELENNLSRFTNETLFSLDEEMYMDYSKYQLVVVPQQESINDDKLGNRTVQLTDSGNEFPSRIAILGGMMALEITYHENPLVEGSETKTVKLEQIKDEIITVMSKMPYD
ncbi:hypothetical protein HZI73_04895 [Vallitalea pronyensis]|uniref:Lipoprotein n=1 Tax=Vallitalea pronyensis TaxID=1348613 RepID=A0A8J8SFH6_9FIRM|nr:hypothetical protein [Vallitalea pronyensis]QUI21670.1 hypothetical protein HZI73_04895 [Vallitalea pronyensis]